MSRPNICFIGVGNMGNPMAVNLLRASYNLTVFDLDPNKTKNLISLGAKSANSIKEATAGADLILVSLPGPPQVREVILGKEGVLNSIKEGATIIDTSTSSVELAKEIQESSLSKKVKYLEAPITNAVDGAALGELAFFIAGDKNCFEENLEIFNILGSDLFFVGEHGNGSITKLITNLLWFVNAAAIGEGLMLGKQANIPLETIAEAIKASAGDSWVARHDITSIFEGHYDPSFSLELCCKDLGLVNDIAKNQGFDLTMGAKAQEVFRLAKDKYGASAPELSVVKILEEKMNTLLRPSENYEKSQTEDVTSSQSDLMKEAHNHMPQGVAENYRYWGDDSTVFVKESKGFKFTDTNGKEYADFRLGYGPIILGYADERVDTAVIRQISKGGTLSGFATGLDTKVVKQIKEMCPNIEKMRFANSGTEAVMGAVRTARGFTKRDRIVIVEGGFHGLYDEMMWKSDVENWEHGSDVAPEVIPFGGGIPKNARSLVDLLPLNSFEELEKIFKEKGDEIACVLLEPIIGNCGSISSTKEWLLKLKETCHAHGALLIMDEVKTGFRVARGGAQELYGVHADLTTYAKAIGNGYPVAAFGGRADVMDVVGSHAGGVVHGGTYTANLIGLSAASATLEILKNTTALETVNRVGQNIMDVLSKVFTKHGIKHTFAGPPSMFGIHFSEIEPTNYRDWRVTDSSLYEKFAWNLIEGGVMLEPDSREPWFICESHSGLDLKWLEKVADNALGKAISSSNN
jgi:glutamate-1-semialdehyde 2,1-aminomutase